MTYIDVLFAWELGGGLGHIGRLRPLAEALQQQGKSVAFAVRDVRFCGTVFKDSAIPWFQAPVKLGRPQREIAEPRTFADILHNVGFESADELRSMVAAWRNLFATLRPKLVVLEHAPTALLALRGLDIQSAVVGLGFFCPPDQDPLPDLRPWLGTAAPRGSEARVLANMNQVLGSFGQPPLERISQMYAEADELALVTFPELDHYGARPKTRYWGAWDSSWGSTPQWPAAGEKRVFFYLKPCPILSELLKAPAALNLSAMIYVPELPPEQIRAQVDHHSIVLSKPANLREVFAGCDLAVLHGTHGVATEALLRGTPLLNFPLTLEQALLSQRIERIGAGVLGNTNDPAAVLPALARSLDTRILRQRAYDFSTRYASLDSSQQASKLASRLALLTSN